MSLRLCFFVVFFFVRFHFWFYDRLAIVVATVCKWKKCIVCLEYNNSDQNQKKKKQWNNPKENNGYGLKANQRTNACNNEARTCDLLNAIANAKPPICVLSYALFISIINFHFLPPSNNQWSIKLAHFLLPMLLKLADGKRREKIKKDGKKNSARQIYKMINEILRIGNTRRLLTRQIYKKPDANFWSDG